MKKTNKPMKPLTIRLPEPLLKSLQDSAAESGKSLNQMTIDALERGLTGLSAALPPDLIKHIESLAKQELRPVDMQIQYLLRFALKQEQAPKAIPRKK